MELKFTYQQERAIEAGERKRKYLQGISKMAAMGVVSKDKYRNYYIYGPSGVGKTYNIEKAVKESGVVFKTLSGNNTMYTFFTELALVKWIAKDEKVVIIIDDCDELFKDAKNINMMKELLDRGKMTYNALIHLNNFGEEGDDQYDAMANAQRPNGIGYEVDCPNFSFIITSNIPLPNEKEVEAKIEKNGGIVTGRLALLKHMLAIATRVMPKNCDFDKDEKWGNIASITLEDAEGYFSDLTEQQKIHMLKWIYDKWDRMTQTSVRTAEQMAQMYTFFGNDVEDAWETEYLM